MCARLAGAAAGVPSQPPAGVLTWIAASGCGSAIHVLHRGLRCRRGVLIEPGADLVALLG